MFRKSLLSALITLLAVGVIAQNSPEYAKGEVIVKFPEGGVFTGALSNAMLGAKPVQNLDGGSVLRVKLPASTSMQSALAIYRAMGAEYAEPNYVYRAVYTPNDPMYSQQYGPQLIHCPDAWEITKGSSSVIVAIVDTGVDLTHPDLSAKIVQGTDFVNGDSVAADDNGHGTHCAGVAAASTNNGVGIAGVAPNCLVMPVKVLDSSGSGYLSNIALGIRWAADHGAKVISLSLGSSSSSQAMQDAVNYATGKGALVVAAAGNSNLSSKFYPAACTNVLSVGAVTSGDQKASFSNYGSWVSVAGPGVNVLSCWMGHQYAYASGTSMATPHVAGEAALLYSYFGATATPAFVRQHIEDNCDPVGTWVAHGRVNVLAAITGPGNPGGGGGTPSEESVGLTGFTVLQGKVLSGSLSSMSASDNIRFALQSNGSTFRRSVECWGAFHVGPGASISKVVFDFKGSLTTAGPVTVSAYNFTKRKWVDVGTMTLQTSDTTISAELKLIWAQFVNPAGEMRVRLYRSVSAKVAYTLSIDLFKLTVTPL